MRWLLIGLLVACSDGGSPAADAPPDEDARVLPDGQGDDGGPPLSWVDFTVTGCAVYDPAGPSCSGPVPLDLRFAALASAEVDSFLWDFGDGSDPYTEPTPEHVYALPGSYTVRLSAGGPGGTAQIRKDMFVLADFADEGSPCAEDAACEPGLECLCAGGVCSGTLAVGLCSQSCEAALCDAGTVCAELGDAAVWGGRRCLATCTDDGGCHPPYRCRELRGAGGGWVQGCFADDVLGDDGTPCVDGFGALHDEACASGRCLDLGARGLCAADCGGGCASYADCATFTGGLEACLARCADRSCDADPWLACEAAEPSGDLGFVAPGGPYCAPRRCPDADACGTGGACLDLGGASFCGSP